MAPNYGDQRSCIALGDEFHEEIPSGQVHFTKNPLGRNGASLGVPWLPTGNKGFVDGDDVASTSHLNGIRQLVLGTDVPHKAVPINGSDVADGLLTRHLEAAVLP